MPRSFFPSLRGYEDSLGWREADAIAAPTDLYEPLERPTDEDLLSSLERGWQSITSHTAGVRASANAIMKALALVNEAIRSAIDEAVRWHDYGKAIEEWGGDTRRVAIEARLVWPSEIAPIGKFSFQESPLLEGLAREELGKPFGD